ncbi:phosphoenolpyruvate-protein phosphotransferase [Burkholderia ambifaria AMMD]|uniref:phosphoenolpyruvate--protein phosphotransferase n=1 Tax=Burkholderia ambifaria (strain ATCC BAA-244 / DSM 16087 / CCUG 44356 / LMG 19182 / AMMD) TaxID=339670 RepID=Q0BBN5_BURCM|nr:phosphoenolpyruvate--protein phosphotransferase [Burkholderia ambifaria]ABI88438.1 PTS system IIA component, Glc family / Phosphocarrier protein HPr [Burkholderia ambifaria AMMD]AJY20889.1 phosphoenolpyruvate-protein phosphotransferase [Burkholderia ambifaria AMMD]MBR7931447.1 phosphoenolpyruvate--protein phosphotransferase [Burkholderia ambifaria]PEH64431.1 phosphoenolpyruvate--protein phosphotransferase [Burkholderia ambifaria]QQC04383.1 phosphoenolpyruvate--protein phosphotransferase [Bu
MRRAEESQLKSSTHDPIVLHAPLTGPIVALADVPDPVFSGGMFGDGIGIDPLAGRLVAPCAGVVSHLARTGHALTITTPQGAEVLLHIGIDTVELNGQGFTAHVEAGARVAAGDLLIEFDQDAVARSAHSLVSVIAIANSDAFEVVERASGFATAGETPLLTLRGKGEAAAQAAQAGAAAMQEVRRELVLTQPGGLHARPAARARESVRGIDATVDVQFDGRKASITSVVGLLGLGAGEGATIELIGRGAYAQQAVEAVERELLREAHGEVEEKPARLRSPAPQMAVRNTGASLDPNTLAGVCAAPGIAVGTLVRLDDADIVPPEQASGTPASESRRLDQALKAVDAELDETVRNASARGAVGEAGIFAVHRVLLEDPTLVDAARDQISLGKSAGFAWRATIRAQIDTLSKLDDALLAERAADLRDIEKRVLRALGHTSGATRALPDEAVLAAEEFTPSDLSSLDRQRVTALVMARGGATSHAAIIARQLGIPALVAVGDALYAIPDGTQVVVDASAGRLEHAPTALDVERARHERQRLDGVREANRQMAGAAAATTDGRAIEVAANIATLDDANTAVDNGADAIGLLRTELMFIHRQSAPSAVEHQQSYQSIVDALQGRTAIIRTLDVGADKEVDYLTLPPEPNPALGLRGIRLAQVRPDLLDDQLQGLLAVWPFGAVRILLPMVTDAGELVRLRKRIDEFARAQGRTEPIEVGVMIEVPSAALLADQLAQHADFLSIGTNDLTQYTLAMDRCQADLAAQSDGLHPAVLRLIDIAVRGAAKHGKWVGVCGALGGDPLAVPILVGLGVTELSVDPVSVPGIKARVRRLDYQLCRQRAQDLLALDSAQAVRAASREVWPLD